MTLEKYSHVMHLTSEVSGSLVAGKSPIDVLRATLPAGTVSGAPKVRAMEIIDSLEPVKRGPYAGVVGYVDGDGRARGFLLWDVWGKVDDARALIRSGAATDGDVLRSLLD